MFKKSLKTRDKLEIISSFQFVFHIVNITVMVTSVSHKFVAVMLPYLLFNVFHNMKQAKQSVVKESLFF